MPVRCSTCGRSDLPVVPGTLGGNGTLAFPVAHVRTDMNVSMASTTYPGGPCFAGVWLVFCSALADVWAPDGAVDFSKLR